MQRRDFIGALTGTAAWPIAAWAQQGDAVKRIAWIGTQGEDGITFGQELARLGWIEGRNVHVDYRVETDNRRMRALAPVVVAAAPNVIVTVGTDTADLFKQLTNTIPIVFSHVPDPVATGLVVSFARPGGNLTGFTNHQFSFGGKWLSLLRQMVPSISKVMILYEPANPNWQGFLPVLEAAAPSFPVTIYPAAATVVADVVSHIETFSHEPGGGMIVLPTGLTVGDSKTIIALSARHHLPSIYPFKFFATNGGLMSYGASLQEQARHTAQYADRILRGIKAADLPVQAPTAFEFVINLATAKAIGIDVPPVVIALADEVIE